MKRIRRWTDKQRRSYEIRVQLPKWGWQIQLAYDHLAELMGEIPKPRNWGNPELFSAGL